MSASPLITIQEAVDRYIDSVSLARSEKTAATYRNGLRSFLEVLEVHDLDPKTIPVQDLKEDTITWFASSLKVYAATTERLYLTAASSFFEFLAAEKLAEPNLPRIKLLIRQRARRPGQRLPQFPREAIERVVDYAQSLTVSYTKNEADHLRNLRDRAFILTLADTGLRVHEATGLHRGDLDQQEKRAIIIGKGNREAVVRFSTRSLRAIQDYLAARAALDGSSGRPLGSLPLFARHDKRVARQIRPITTTTGRNIITERVTEALGPEAAGTITPHSFRHYFVTTVLRGSGGNLKMAQELARHKNIAVTQRYAHLSDDELDQGYWEVFEEDK